MHDSNVKLCSVRRCVKTIITFGYCDIRNSEGLAKYYQQRPNAKASSTYPLLRPLLFRISQKPHPIIVCPLVWAVCVRALRVVPHKYLQARRVPFFSHIGGLYLFIRTLKVNCDSVSSTTAPLANFQWQNYNSYPSIELCRSGLG